MTLRFPSSSSLWMLALLVWAAAAPRVAAKNVHPELWTELARRPSSAKALPSFAPLYEKARAAALVITTEGTLLKGDMPTGKLPPGHPPLPGPDDFGVQGQGSGFLIHPTGLALTNYHVVENAERIWVRVGEDPVEIEAKVIGKDPKSDVALIGLQGQRQDWPALPLGDSERARVGDFALAIGNPFGLEHSVSLGVISARGRREIHPNGQSGLYDFLQTDASINVGNSGGPLMNLSGEVIGMNTAINAVAQGIGFAIPINMIKDLLPALRSEGRVIRSWLGVIIDPVTQELAQAYGLERPAGALVRQVVKEGPAFRAGLEPGDIIVRFAGQTIADVDTLPLLSGAGSVGRQVALDVVRDGKSLTLPVLLEAHPDNLPAPQERDAAAMPTSPKEVPLGMRIVTLNPEDRARLGIPAEVSGARIVDVKLGTRSFDAGLQPDDIVVRLNADAVTDAKGFAERVQAVPPQRLLRLWVQRGEDIFFVAIPKP